MERSHHTVKRQRNLKHRGNNLSDFPRSFSDTRCVGPRWRHLGRKLRICGLAGFPGLLKGFMSLWAHSLLFVCDPRCELLIATLAICSSGSPPLLMDSNLQGEKPNQQKTKPPNSLWKVAAAAVFYESNRKNNQDRGWYQDPGVLLWRIWPHGLGEACKILVFYRKVLTISRP